MHATNKTHTCWLLTFKIHDTQIHLKPECGSSMVRQLKYKTVFVVLIIMPYFVESVKEKSAKGKERVCVVYHCNSFFLYIFVTHSVRWPNFGQNKSKHFDIVLIKWPISLHYYWPAAHFIHFSLKIEKKTQEFSWKFVWISFILIFSF